MPFGGAWTLKRVVQHLFKDTIQEKAKEAGLTSKDSEWLKKCNQIAAEIVDGLSDEDKEKYEEAAKKWSEMGPPAAVKRK